MRAVPSRGKRGWKQLSLSLSLSTHTHTCARNSHQDVGSLPCALKTSCKVLVVALEKTVLTSGASCPCALPPEPRDELVCPVPPSEPVPPNGAIARLQFDYKFQIKRVGATRTEYPAPVRTRYSCFGVFSVARFQCSGWSKSGIHGQIRLFDGQSRASQGLSTDVLHLWWKTPPPPQNTSTMVGNLK